MAPKIRIEPSSLEITVEVFEGRHLEERDVGGIVVVDSLEADVDLVVLLDVAGTRIRYELARWDVGLCDLTVMVVPETARVFLGGRRSSSVVDLASGTVGHRFEHCLFWGFDRVTRPGAVLETGELDCLFRRLDGEVVGMVPVDPPWEIFVEQAGVRFESICHGRQVLAFPPDK